jgi:hypothetical protein
VHTEDPNCSSHGHEGATLRTVGALRLTTIAGDEAPQRRRTPRRQSVQPVLTDRRRGDRRQTTLGVDGLLRTVLADDWL